MAISDRAGVVELLQHLGGGLESLRDRQLLQRFAEQGDEDAFAVLVRRHGPLVLSVCRRMLRNDHDAEDAFQAAFLVLARKAGSVAWQDCAAGWLHEVACRVAAEARGKLARRRSREHSMDTMPEVPSPSIPGDSELAAALDEELRRLPEHYRTPLLLCCLEGRSREEAADHLGCTPGMVKGRLERGRRLLAERLARRGVPVASTALVALAPTVVRAALVGRTAKLASAFLAGNAAAGTAAVRLAEIVLRSLVRAQFLPLAGIAAVLLAAAGVSAAFFQADMPRDRAPTAQPDPSAERTPKPERFVPSQPREVVKVEHSGEVRSVVFTPDGKSVVSASFDGTVRLWDSATGKTSHEWTNGGVISALAVSNDGKLLAAGNASGELIVWDLDTKKERFGRLTRQRNVYGISFSPDGRTVATANHNGTVSLWNTTTGANLMHIQGHPNRVWSASWSSDGKNLLSSGEDGTVRLWDAATGKERWRIAAHSDYASAAVFSPDGRDVVSVGYDGRMHVCAATTGKERKRLEIPPAPSVGFSPDGRTLAVTDREGGLHVYDAVEGKQLFGVRKHVGQVHLVAWASDGRRVVTGGRDGTARVWTMTPEQR